MVITFPHMGPMYIPVKALFDELGVKIVVPPRVSSIALETGTKSSPEMACLPLKINMGNYIESIKKGADTILLSGSCGPCRFGYYGVVQKGILRDMGYDVDVIILDPPKEGVRRFLNNIRKISGDSSIWRGIKAINSAFKVSEEVEGLHKLALNRRCRELRQGDTDRILSTMEGEVLKSKGAKDILACIEKARTNLLNVSLDKNARPLRVGLTGEIYTLIEPFVNLNIEKRLGNMGVQVYREMTVDHWVKYHISPDLRHRKRQRGLMDRSKEYLGLCIGGHAQETIAHSLEFARSRLDGIIQVMPFGCMPEIVAESILPTISKDENTPIMTLIVDEMTGEAGYQTRLEAFVDLLKLRRNKREDEYRKTISGY